MIYDYYVIFQKSFQSQYIFKSELYNNGVSLMTDCSNRAPNAWLYIYVQMLGLFWYFNTGLVLYEYVFLGQVSLLLFIFWH